MSEKKALIMGAGPAGLTAAYELLKRSSIRPIVLETEGQVGGLSKTIHYKGNCIDIGGHRFFSKSDRVMKWWFQMLPFQYGKADGIFDESGISSTHQIHHPDHTDTVMLRRQRISHIYYLRKFFDYPISITLSTMRALGIVRIFKIVTSYFITCLFPIKHENTLEDFFINRFGKELYQTFFKDYTHKVWGIPASAIKPEWGAQRIKGISIKKVIINAVKNVFSFIKKPSRKKVETSWIDAFWYPKYGPGQMWERVAQKVQSMDGTVLLHHTVKELLFDGKKIVSVKAVDEATGNTKEFVADYFFSTMPISALIAGMKGPVPRHVLEIAQGLKYRDFITVGLLLKKMHVKVDGAYQSIIPDNWIYIQESDVKVGRLQIFNNWSPYLVKDPDTVWVGLEYFAHQGDELWEMNESELSQFAINELVKIGMLQREDVLDSVVAKVPHAYPVYYGSYDRFDEIKKFINGIENLYLIGRNGMHKYNNQDHSMLAAMVAVDTILDGTNNKESIWNVNTEKEYHEERQ